VFLNNGTLACHKWTIPDGGGSHHQNMWDFVFALRNALFKIRKWFAALKSPAGLRVCAEWLFVFII